ncbi:hypothetical protein SUDANB95_03463 [Actinosynnema sp. ALI-1.44]
MLGRLEDDPAYARPATAQERVWDQGVRPGGSSDLGQSGMSPRTFRRGLAVLGLTAESERRLVSLLFRPNWDRNGTRHQRRFQVDHIVELQVVRPADRAVMDSFSNYELLDSTSNGSSGSRLAANITAERARLAGLYGPMWLTAVLRFTQVVPTPPPSGQRWTSAEIEAGVHIDVRERMGR